MYRLFYNYKVTGDILFVLLDPEQKVDHAERKGRVEALYADNKLVGINIFNVSEVFHLKTSGIIFAPEKPLLDVVNSMALKFIVDSSIGISQAEALKKGLYFVPLAITIGGKTYTEGVDITADEFYKLIDNGPLPKTSQPSPQLYVDAFNDATKNGDDVLLLSISSKVSGAFQAANLAKTM